MTWTKLQIECKECNALVYWQADVANRPTVCGFCGGRIEVRDVTGEDCSKLPWGRPPDEDMGVKYDSDKPQWSLVPWEAMFPVVRVLTFGARKYSPDNWRKVPDWRRRYFDACQRHLMEYLTGSPADPETNEDPLAHAICCLLFLLGKEMESSDCPEDPNIIWEV